MKPSMILIMERAASMFLLFTILNFHKIYAAEFGSISGSMFLTEGDTLVSMTGVFELGIFKPEGSENRYLGIWYKKIAPQTVVWVANRNRPLPGASPLVLRVSDPGSLVLFNSQSMIWSSNTTLTSSNATAKLYDNGNLVLLDQQEKVIWQSFDYLTDTLLPGMKLGKDFVRGIEWHLSSWKSNQDPAPGAFTWGANTSVYPENKLRQGAMVTFRGGPWSNERFTGVSVFSTVLTFTYDVVVTEREVSFSYNLENRSSLLSRVTLNSSGDFISWAWVEESKKWQTVLSLPRDICDTYNICSAYGKCNVDLTQQSCTCLDEKRFVPRSKRDWGMANWSGGCVRRTPLDCKIGSEGFIKYSNVKLPDTQNTWYNTSMTLKECETKCLKDCTCMAYANTNVRGEGTVCLIWLSDLIDIRVFPEGSGGRDIYVRMASSELGKEKKGAPIKIILPLIFLGLLLLGVSITWFWCARRKRKYADDMAEEGKSLNVSKGQEEAMELPIFSFSTIEEATSNFSPENKIGEGGFGVVYKGRLEEGKEIAVKRLSRYSNQGVDEFKNEVICISKLQHRNLVKLLGCCIQGDEKLLIYEYMPNKNKTQSMILDWTKRFNIIKGIARGLLYLHQDSRLRIIHRDLKASNVLLDEDLNPKISDFGIARSFGGNETQANTERVVGTYGYMSPEYALDGIFSTKSDVFSFGVLVLEIVSGKRNRGFVQPGSDNNLIGHTWSLYSEGRSMELIDSNIAESCRSSEVLRSIELGLLCVQQNAVDRPSISNVILMLSGEGPLPQPKQPVFFMDKEFLVADFSSGTYTGGSVNGITITEVVAR
uniref:G-type lectin S-receptor-like serine/threonine-protein kinase At4g27290 isoform X2 n=1 Tax=Erigeron canadensis TaxID=72917 RepID=UPI001CB8E853|nr:G-type lectin S-receptor-like serine/threonine-protein kinase At4g27290 isoform X2 [Erigeron canadensis]